MTPAINQAKKSNITFRVHEYEHDPSSESYGEEAARKLGVDGDRVFKTLVVDLGSSSLAVAVVPVTRQLDLKLFAKVLGFKKADMADKKDVERVTGYVLGGVSPIGQKKSLPTVVDETAKGFETIYVSAGRRGLEIELSPSDLCLLTKGRFGGIGR
jgi:Cys-tRNA(Pro)/Cys-tRNA(Cys) deacylase